MDKIKLMKTANEVRKGIVTSVHSAKAGHPGGSLSAADIFTYLYFEELNIDPTIRKKRIATGSCCLRATLRPGFMRLWLREDISRKRT